MGARSHLSPEILVLHVWWVHDVITGNKFHQNRLRGFRATGSENRVLPLTWLVALTTVRHYRADCDLPIILQTASIAQMLSGGGEGKFCIAFMIPRLADPLLNGLFLIVR